MVVSHSPEEFFLLYIGMVVHSSGTLITFTSRERGGGSGTLWNDIMWNVVMAHDSGGCGLGCLEE